MIDRREATDVRVDFADSATNFDDFASFQPAQDRLVGQDDAPAEPVADR